MAGQTPDNWDAALARLEGREGADPNPHAHLDAATRAVFELHGVGEWMYPGLARLVDVSVDALPRQQKTLLGGMGRDVDAIDVYSAHGVRRLLIAGFRAVLDAYAGTRVYDGGDAVWSAKGLWTVFMAIALSRGHGWGSRFIAKPTAAFVKRAAHMTYETASSTYKVSADTWILRVKAIAAKGFPSAEHKRARTIGTPTPSRTPTRRDRSPGAEGTTRADATPLATRTPARVDVTDLAALFTDASVD